MLKTYKVEMLITTERDLSRMETLDELTEELYHSPETTGCNAPLVTFIIKEVQD